MNTIEAKTYLEQQLYSDAIISAIDDATELEVAFGSGADGIFEWATSLDGQSVMALAGYEADDGTARMLKSCVLECARTKRHHIEYKKAA